MKRLLQGTAALGLALGFAGMAHAEGYKIGISNTVQGNGWREEMVCAMKAQALVSGKVESLNIAHRNTDAAGQLEDIRRLGSVRSERDLQIFWSLVCLCSVAKASDYLLVSVIDKQYIVWQ